MTSESAGSIRTLSAPPAVWLRRLWERMVAMYGHAWHSVQGASPQDDAGKLTVAGETWSTALAGLEGSEFAAGLSACIADGREFPPSAPRFRAMCLGIPSFARVKDETTRADAERSPFTRMAWAFVNGYDYRHADVRDAERMLRAAYDHAVEDRMRGVPLPAAAAAALEHHVVESVRATPEQAQKHQAAIAAALGLPGGGE